MSGILVDFHLASAFLAQLEHFREFLASSLGVFFCYICSCLVLAVLERQNSTSTQWIFENLRLYSVFELMVCSLELLWRSLQLYPVSQDLVENMPLSKSHVAQSFHG
jgi:hypothetical protein